MVYRVIVLKKIFFSKYYKPFLIKGSKLENDEVLQDFLSLPIP
jgi:hypothetical protein